MKKEQFQDFWVKGSQEWYNSSIKNENQTLVPVKELCCINPSISDILYRRYVATKKLVKETYFKDPSKKLSKYKRAAVIAQVIILSDPLEYSRRDSDGLDPYFLKQRLAFFMAIESILQAYPKSKIDSTEKPIFHFDELDKNCCVEDDGFLMSVYKDMFYSEIYENYNVLTMANVFGLITERLSELGEN